MCNFYGIKNFVIIEYFKCHILVFLAETDQKIEILPSIEQEPADSELEDKKDTETGKYICRILVKANEFEFVPLELYVNEISVKREKESMKQYGQNNPPENKAQEISDQFLEEHSTDGSKLEIVGTPKTGQNFGRLIQIFSTDQRNLFTEQLQQATPSVNGGNRGLLEFPLSYKGMRKSPQSFPPFSGVQKSAGDEDSVARHSKSVLSVSFRPTDFHPMTEQLPRRRLVPIISDLRIAKQPTPSDASPSSTKRRVFSTRSLRLVANKVYEASPILRRRHRRSHSTSSPERRGSVSPSSKKKQGLESRLSYYWL